VGNDGAFQDQIRQLGKLITQFDQFPDGSQKSACKELVQLLMDVHGAGLETDDGDSLRGRHPRLRSHRQTCERSSGGQFCFCSIRCILTTWNSSAEGDGYHTAPLAQAFLQRSRGGHPGRLSAGCK